VTWRRWSFLVLHPPPGEDGAGNDRSLVIDARAGGRSLLLTGDIPERVETALVRRRVLQPVDLLKVAHHGSRTSTSPGFVAAVQPKIALVSCGRRNRFGHPASVTLSTLAGFCVPLLRTDERSDCRVELSPEAARLAWRGKVRP
jgi:competence protein ComEC